MPTIFVSQGVGKPIAVLQGEKRHNAKFKKGDAVLVTTELNIRGKLKKIRNRPGKILQPYVDLALSGRTYDMVKVKVQGFRKPMFLYTKKLKKVGSGVIKCHGRF